jgi:hypothetical protein
MQETGTLHSRQMKKRLLIHSHLDLSTILICISEKNTSHTQSSFKCGLEPDPGSKVPDSNLAKNPRSDRIQIFEAGRNGWLIIAG